MMCELQTIIKQLLTHGSYSVAVTVPVRQALTELSKLYLAWSQKLATFSASTPPSECYRFLANFGLVYRSHLGQHLGSLIPVRSASSESARQYHEAQTQVLCFPASAGSEYARPESASDQDRQRKRLQGEFDQVAAWAIEVFQKNGIALAAQALQVCDLQGWRERAGELLEESESAGPENWCDESVHKIASKAEDLLRQLDETELVCALASLAVEFLSPPIPPRRIAALQQGAVLEELPQHLEVVRAQIRECLDWLEDHPEAFLPADKFILTLAAGLREDLEDFADLAITAWKFAELVDAFVLADGISFPQESRDWLENLLRAAASATATAQVEAAYPGRQEPILEPLPIEVASPPEETPTARLFQQTAPLIPTLAYPRTVLHSFLAAASGQTLSTPVLHWRSPDQRYEARLVRGADQCMLRFYTAAGHRACELEGERFCLAGLVGQVGAEAHALLDRASLEQSGEDIYLEVGTPPKRWIPIKPIPTSHASGTKS